MAITSAERISESQTESGARIQAFETRALGSIDVLESLSNTDTDSREIDSPNVALAPEEVATLKSLMERYDHVLQEVDRLNLEIENLLKVESAKLGPVDLNDSVVHEGDQDRRL